MSQEPKHALPASLTSVGPERRGVSRRRRSGTSDSGVPPVGSAPPPRDHPRGAPRQPPRVALLTAHGMGQQVKFETLDLVATALRREALRRGRPEPSVAVRLLRFDDDTIARAELTLRDADGHEREVHLFEAYWAPLTEGQISIFQTIAFLLKSGWAGLTRSTRGFFHRFMFGRNQRLPVGPRAGLAFVAALAVMLALFTLTVETSLVALTRLVTGGRRIEEGLVRRRGSVLVETAAMDGQPGAVTRGDIEAAIQPELQRAAVMAATEPGENRRLTFGIDGGRIRIAHLEPGDV